MFGQKNVSEVFRQDRDPLVSFCLFKVPVGRLFVEAVSGCMGRQDAVGDEVTVYRASVTAAATTTM